MASEALRMVINLQVDETLLSDFHCYQQQHSQEPQAAAATATATACAFPKQIKMFPWNDVQQITQHIYEQTHIPIQRQRLFFRGREITAYHSNRPKKSGSSPTLSFFGIGHESTIYLQCRAADDEKPIVPYGFCSALLTSLQCSDGNKQLIHACTEGLFDDMRPQLANDGEGGTYFMRDDNNQKVACFKPSDEEAGCLNNPRGRTDAQQAIHSGIKPSQGHLREVAAYLMDYDGEHFHGVPPTIRVEIAYPGFHYNKENDNTHVSPSGTTTSTKMQSMYHPPHKKVGALQKFIAGEVIENFGVKNFTQREVHKIGILDIRILNCDRNTGNVLVSRDEFGRYALQPIDHGLSLPEKIEITRDSWVWLHWQQSKQPFDPYTLNFIKSIDVERDIAQLRAELNLAEIVFENMRIAHLVLTKGAAKGLTLHEIGSIIARPDFDTKSILEELMTQAEILAIEKWRQRRHFSNRMRLRTRRSHTLRTPQHGSLRRYPDEEEDGPPQKQQQQQQISQSAKNSLVQKFMDKGKTLKVPLIGTHYVPSLVPSHAHTHTNGYLNGLNGLTQSREIQLVKRSVHVESAALTASAGSLHSGAHHHDGGEQTHAHRTIHTHSLSPNPMSLHHSTSLGSGGKSFGTPEPFQLYNHGSAQQKQAQTQIVHRANSNLNLTKRSPQFDIFFTPNFGSQSQSSTSSMSTRSVTPDRCSLQVQESPPLMPPAFYLEHNSSNHNHEQHPLPIKSFKTVERTRAQRAAEAVEAAAEEENIFSPVQIQALELEKLSSIHGRQHETGNHRKQQSSSTMNTMAILQSISNSRSMMSSGNSSSSSDTADEVSDDNIKLRASSDEDEGEQEEQAATLEKVHLEAVTNKKKRLRKLHPFSLLSVDTSFSASKRHSDDETGAHDCVATAEMVPLERSTSCLDVRKSSMSLKSAPALILDSRSTKSLQMLANVAGVGAQTSNPLALQLQHHDEDFLFSKSASLINHPSMLEARKQTLALKQQQQQLHNEDSNHSLHSQSTITAMAADVAASGSLSQISGGASILDHVQPHGLPLHPLKLSDSPANSVHNNNSHTTNLLNSPSTGSQDDLITAAAARGKCEFLIHPIMERMAKENEFVRQWFMHYLDQLLEIQCRRIRNRQCNKKKDELDDIYDVDTVKGSFVWKNELRKHWIRSRVELKKILNENSNPPTNPFAVPHHDEDSKNDHKKSETEHAHAVVVRKHSADRHSISHGDDAADRSHGDESEETGSDEDDKEEDQGDWFAGDRLEDHDLSEEEEEEEEEDDWFRGVDSSEDAEQEEEEEDEEHDGGGDRGVAAFIQC